MNPQSIVIDDLNLDGFRDAIVHGVRTGFSGVDGSISLFFGNSLSGFGTENRIVLGAVAQGRNSVVTANLNADAHPDIGATTAEEAVAVILITATAHLHHRSSSTHARP